MGVLELDRSYRISGNEIAEDAEPSMSKFDDAEDCTSPTSRPIASSTVASPSDVSELGLVLTGTDNY